MRREVWVSPSPHTRTRRRGAGRALRRGVRGGARRSAEQRGALLSHTPAVRLGCASRLLPEPSGAPAPGERAQKLRGSGGEPGGDPHSNAGVLGPPPRFNGAPRGESSCPYRASLPWFGNFPPLPRLY